MDGGSGVGRISAAAERLSAPRSLKATNVGVAGVTLKWTAPKGAKPAHYVILRDGKSLGKTTRNTYTDSKVKPGTTYRYAVRALDARKRAGALSSSVRVKVPKPTPLGPPAPTSNTVPPIATVTPTPLGSGPEPPGPSSTPTPTASPTPTATPTPTPVPDILTTAMVDRLFWRAGFGPLQSERDTWTGRRHAELVDFFLNTPSALATTTTPPLTGDTPPEPIDPAASDIELELEWIDRMQRAINPFPERLAFFWHRHWAISREEGDIPIPWVVKYRDLLLKYGDLGTYPAATFRALSYDMTTLDSAMSLYLNMYQNVRGKPNENYAREFMELFCLGPTDPDGTPNYSQDDVAGLSKAFTGWALNTSSASVDYGKITFTPSRFELTAKTFLGITIPAVTQANANGPNTINTAIDAVLAHPNHAQFLIRKLWVELIASPIPQVTLDGLITTYRNSGFQLKPLLRGILMNPLIFESIGEPNLIKPPIVYLVGALRQLQAPLRGSHMQAAMNNMQQRVYRPPNVAGWEGGMSWLNTNTVQGRWDLITRVQYLKYSNYYSGTAAPPADIVSETGDAAFERAHASVNRPWLSIGTRASLLAYANSLATPTNTAAFRRQRFYTLQILMLGGPDGQVM